jgi:hypothetical protein
LKSLRKQAKLLLVETTITKADSTRFTTLTGKQHTEDGVTVL